MRFSRAGLATALVLGAVVTAGAQSGNTITVPISGLRNNNGEVRCGLFNSSTTFRQAGRQMMGVAAPIAN